MLLGDWLYQERKKKYPSQHLFAEKLNVSQSSVSIWENNKAVPSIAVLNVIVKLLGKTLRDIPFDRITFEEGDDGKMTKRMSLYELPCADSVRTFEGKTFVLKGFIGIEIDSGEVQHVSELYYRARTVVTENQVTAKRKKKEDELTIIHPKKINGCR